MRNCGGRRGGCFFGCGGFADDESGGFVARDDDLYGHHGKSRDVPAGLVFVGLPWNGIFPFFMVEKIAYCGYGFLKKHDNLKILLVNVFVVRKVVILHFIVKAYNKSIYICLYKW